ncbi:sulfite exporter TauE/SafE family protein [Gluconacetobacter tumulisoli]|uniref:Probable membrane transporter protein n=1 Tax=Gluconacetobacter tumulisoli TaxID=1286189 RepID=A0A7W4K4Y3_9PROT|nr:sulfite exporter TauE/SafE family protein [Gluconacetobacter tumulisoli]MBB2200489.1 sulfite exporter TauE/SafE family protein [Gluconacetobacter tumulisoli]
MLVWCLILLASVLAFCLSTVSGGGAGLVLMPLLGLVVPAAQVPATLSIGAAASSLARIATFRRSIRWAVVRRFVPAALPFAALGAWGLSRMNPAYLDVLLGLFLMGNLPLLFRTPGPVSDRPIRPSWLVATGAAAGFLSGFTGAVGLVFNGFYRRLGLRKEEIVATRAANEILLHLMKLGLYAGFGLLTTRAVTVGLAVAMAAILSSVLMRHVLPRMHDHLFRHIGHAATVAAGVGMLALAGGQIVRQDGMSLHYGQDASEFGASLSWRRHVFSIALEHHDEIELSHTVRAIATGHDGLIRNPTYLLHVSPRTGIRPDTRV